MRICERDSVIKRIKMMAEFGRGSLYVHCTSTTDMTASDLRSLHGMFRSFEDITNDIDFYEARWSEIATQVLQEHPQWEPPP